MTLLHRPATELIHLVAGGEVSAESVVQAHLDRIDRINPTLNAIIELRADAALGEARAQDEAAAAGRPRGRLGGLPITIKSALEVAGLKCETGSPRGAAPAAVPRAFRAARRGGADGPHGRRRFDAVRNDRRVGCR
jgi:amidase